MTHSLQFRFGAQHARCIDTQQGPQLELPNGVISGSGLETWPLDGTGQCAQADDFLVWQSPEQLCGIAVTEVTDATIEAETERLYRQLLSLGVGYNLHRIWHFVPQINNACGADVDRYMLFCKGRAQVLCDPIEAGTQVPFTDQQLPPASAVGTSGKRLAIAFLAGDAPIQPVENPLQVPAYQYPQRYGPRPPSFARAGRLHEQLIVSGTASIRQSESLHAGDINAQLDLALENIDIVAKAAQHPLPRPGIRARVYVKQADQWHADLEAHPMLRDTRLNVVQADICRNELLVEVEVSSRG
ncbi:MAG: hypothetical protein AAF529_01970 [Pseudomonadota bacterium]